MKVILNGKHSEESSVLALGMFDGVHIGHQVLLERARTLHMRRGAPLVVCTFARHPMELIAPEKAPRLLTTLEERISLISHAGADVFFAMPFDEQMRDQPPECYVGELVRRLHPKAEVVHRRCCRHWERRWASRSAWCRPSPCTGRRSALPPSGRSWLRATFPGPGRCWAGPTAAGSN